MSHLVRNLSLVLTFFLGALPLAAEGNRVIVTDNGLEMFHWDLDFVREAKQSIEVSAVFLGGEIAQALLKTIEIRLEQVPELQVHILTTPTLLEDKDWALIHHLKERYPHNFHLEHASTVMVIWPDVSGIDNHIKMFIVDEKYFSAGGTNLDETQCSDGTWTPRRNFNKMPMLSNGLPAGTRDQDLIGSGPLAVQLRRTFFKLYALWEHYNKTGLLEKDPEKFKTTNRYFPVAQQAHVAKFEVCAHQRAIKAGQIKMIVGGPHQKHNEISKEYVKLIQEACEEIIISNLYFCPVDSILQALLDAVNRGVKLTILTNGITDIAPECNNYFCWANRLHYVPMLYGSKFYFWEAFSVASKPLKKTHIYEYYVRDILLHKKVMIVDGKKNIIGSYNLGFRSDMGDYEMVIRIDSTEVSADLKRVHEKDLKYSREVSAEDARSWYFDPVKAYMGEMQKRFHGLI